MMVLTAERNGLKLKSLDQDSLHDAVIDILSAIKLITGAPVYESDESGMLQRQVEMIKRFLWSGYGLLTKEEVINAFYLNMQGRFNEVYKHYNREINAEYLGDVLNAYIRFKKAVIEIKGSDVQKILSIEYKPAPQMIQVDYGFYKTLIQEEYQAFRNNQKPLTFWSRWKYYTLRKEGLLPFPKGLNTWFWFMKIAAGTGNYQLTIPAGSDLKHYRFTSARQVRTLFRTQKEYVRCLDHARKLAYWHVLHACRECGINNLFDEIAAYKPVKETV